VLLALLDQVYPTKRAGVGHFLRLDILRVEQERFGIKQQHSVGAAGRNHPVGLVERDTEAASHR